MNTQRSGILAAGTLLVDHVHVIDGWPEQGRLVRISHSEDATGGAVPNVLRTLARLKTGLPLAAAGFIGQDSDGEFIRQAMLNDDIDCHHLKAMPHATSMTQVMSNHQNGQRTFFHKEGCNAALDAMFLSGIQTSHKIFHLAYLLLLPQLEAIDSDYGIAAARLLHDIRQQGYLTTLDLVSVNEPERSKHVVLPTLPYVDHLIINELEAETLTGLSLRQNDDTLDTILLPHAARLLLRHGVQKSVIIHCPEGAWAESKSGDSHHQSSFWLDPTEIVGTVGAGDAFCAGVLYGLHQNWPILKTLQLGNACARFNLRSANAIDGAAPLQEVEAFIAAASETQAL